MGRPPRITRQQVLDAARNAFTARGFDGTTLADIGAELGVSAAAILRYADSKQSLFDEAMSSGDLIQPPPAVLELAHVDPGADPRIVLRRVAEGVVPFITGIIASRFVIAMRENKTRAAIDLPFDPTADNPPRRAAMLLASYFAKANAAGVMHVRDPRAAALLFIGALQSYVFFHQILKVQPAYPLPDYIDALLDLWTNGAITQPHHGGTRVPEEARPKTDPRRPAAPRGGGSARVRAQAEPTEAARPRRDAGSEDGQRRVARRRPRHPRTRR
ncbi:MAG TPA: TetR/AcrR family transcriptional regulator [Thermoanaerobaculia bacterium]